MYLNYKMAKEIGQHVKTMNNKRTIPVLGLGTWQSQEDDAKTAVKAALECGYRHIDTAMGYGNEADIGEAIEEFLQRTKTPRDEIFVTTKIPPTLMAPGNIKTACQHSLKKLKLDVLDLLLLHTPISMKLVDMDVPVSWGSDGKFLFEYHSLIDIWKAMEKLVDEGLVRSIGVSNFNSEQITRILKNCRIKPVTNQIECHAYFPQNEMLGFLKDNDMFLTPFSQFTSTLLKEMPSSEGITPLLENKVITDLANKHKKTPGQIVLRSMIQRGMIVIPKSAKPERIKENSQIFDFELNQEDMTSIAGLKKGDRLLDGSAWGAPLHPENPFAAAY